MSDHVKKRLLEAYLPSETGTWRILGEDPNCDLGGSHHEPELETVTGTYANVVDYALSLPNFFQWGGGGRIIKLPSKVKNVDDRAKNIKQVTALEDERKKLQSRLKSIEEELKKLT